MADFGMYRDLKSGLEVGKHYEDNFKIKICVKQYIEILGMPFEIRKFLVIICSRW